MLHFWSARFLFVSVSRLWRKDTGGKKGRILIEGTKLAKRIEENERVDRVTEYWLVHVRPGTECTWLARGALRREESSVNRKARIHGRPNTFVTIVNCAPPTNRHCPVKVFAIYFGILVCVSRGDKKRIFLQRDTFLGTCAKDFKSVAFEIFYDYIKINVTYFIYLSRMINIISHEWTTYSNERILRNIWRMLHSCYVGVSLPFYFRVQNWTKASAWHQRVI